MNAISEEEKYSTTFFVESQWNQASIQVKYCITWKDDPLDYTSQVLVFFS
jgi:hypothetical protein